MPNEIIPTHLKQTIINLLKRKIEAVKVVRETTGWGLAQSKDVVDTLAKELGE